MSTLERWTVSSCLILAAFLFIRLFYMLIGWMV
jgi:hypothetical protein